uniref:Ubiquitin-like modifier-activating enzyme ATG7 n=1 Tax=Rhipicephalus zambeziensis TaxID=60191 RepID=A0A224Z511_9ACAR
MSATPLQFVPFSSSMDGNFWSELSRRKLVQYRLSEGPFDVGAAYSCGSAAGLPALANLDIGSFGHASGGLKTPGSCRLHGLLYLPNSLADMKKMDKSELLRASGERAWAAACDGGALKDPSLLNRFVALIYVDLKKYTFCYWFGFPVVRLPEEVTLAKPPQRLGDVFDDSRTENESLVQNDREQGSRSGCRNINHGDHQQRFAADIVTRKAICSMSSVSI